MRIRCVIKALPVRNDVAMMAMWQACGSGWGGSVCGPETLTSSKSCSSSYTLAKTVCNILTIQGKACYSCHSAQESVVVENNSLSVAQNRDRIKELSQCQGNTDCKAGITENYKQLNARQHQSVVECKRAQVCVDKVNEVGGLQTAYANHLGDKLHSTGNLTTEEKQEWAYLQGVLPQLEADRNAAIHNALMSGDSPEAKQLAINSLAQAIGTSAAGIAAGIGKSGAKGSSLPTPQPTVAANGLVYKSNPKHTLGQASNRPNAGIEPKDSISLFEQSIPSTKQYSNKEVRFAVDSQGNVHRFVGTNGEYHWNGSTADKNALTSDQIPTAI